MKKSLFALCISAVLLTTGCEDNGTTQKLLETEKRLVQLQSDFKSVQNELNQKTQELDALKPAYEKLQTANTNFPALRVEIISIFDKSNTLKLEKDPQREMQPEESHVGLSVLLPKTDIEWLDQLLLEQAFRLHLNEGSTLPKELTAQAFQDFLTKRYEDMQMQAKQDKVIAVNEGLISYYLGQRNNIVSFKMLINHYAGGAHGMYFTQHVNVNTDKKTLIKLDDLVSPEHQSQIKEILWQNYRASRMNEKGEYIGSIEQKDFRVSEQFYFSEAGIHFVYPVYELGAYSEGENEVLMGWYEGNSYLNTDYQRTKKDGFFDDEP